MLCRRDRSPPCSNAAPRASRPSTPESRPAGEPEHEAGLRRDIRRLGTLLGQTLVRQEGPELLDLVERVRRLTRTDRDAAAGLAGARSTPTSATRLVRAFSTYFHLANVTEQVHRGRELRAIRAPRAAPGWRRPSTASQAAGHTPERGRRRPAPRSTCAPSSPRTPPRRPAARVLTKLRRIASLLDELERAIGPDGRRSTRSPSAASAAGSRRSSTSLWQTDELRVVRPDADRRGPQRRLLPRRAAPRRRPAHARGARRGAGADRRRAAARRAAADLRHLDRRRPRRQPERHAATTTLDVLVLQHEHAHPRRARRSSTSCAATSRPPCGSPARRRSSRPRCGPTSSAARARARATGGSTPRSPTGSRSPASARSSSNTRARIAERAPHEPGRDYLGTARAARRPRR